MARDSEQGNKTQNIHWKSLKNKNLGRGPSHILDNTNNTFMCLGFYATIDFPKFAYLMQKIIFDPP